MDDKTLHQRSNAVGKVVTPDEYGRKRAEIQAAKAYLERLENDNEAGRAQYESELLKRVREGEDARQRLLELDRYHNYRGTGPLTIEAAPSTARIEEVPVSPPLLQNGQFTPGLTHSQKPFQSSIPHGIPTTQPTTTPLPPYISQPPPHRENQPYSAAPFRHYVPQTHDPAAHQSQPVRFQQGYHPGFYHQMPPVHHKQQMDNFPKPVQYQKPPVPRQRGPSSSQIPVQNQVQTANVNSSGSQVQVNSVRNTYQDLRSPVHYNSTGVHPVGTSSLMGALGPQTSQSVKSSTPPPPAISVTPAVPENVPKPPQVQIPTPAPIPQLSESEMEDRKLKILAFRSSILEWGKTSQPNTYTEFHNIKVYKALNSALYITSHSKGKEVTEGQNVFFERLWVIAGLPPDAIPFRQGFTDGPSTSGTSLPAPSTAPHAKGTATQSLSAGGSVSTPSHARSSPVTPRQRTLVDPISGAWRSPADADKKRLARDVMFALGKRKQDSVSHSSPNENPAKRQALEAPSTSGGVLRIAEPVVRTSTTAATMLPALQVTSQHTEKPPQPPVTSKPVTGTVATNGISLEPSVQPIESPPPAIMDQSASSSSQSESTPVQNNNVDSQESHLPPTPSDFPQQNGDAVETPSQVARESGSLPSEGPTTTPSQPPPTRSPAPATSPESLQLEPRDSAPVTPLIALPIVPSGPFAASSISHEKGDDQPSSSTKLVVEKPETFNPPPSSQVKPDLPSSSLMDQDVSPPLLNSNVKPDPPSSSLMDQDVSLPLLNSNVDSSGAVWPSSFDFSQEASSSNAREPLFLPSPSSSSSSLASKKNKRSSSVYVLVPPPPEYLIRYRRRQRMKDGLDNNRTSSLVSTSKTSRSLEAFSLPLKRERDVPIDPQEQEAIQFSCSRLQPMPCRWGECDIILNSVDSLIHHLNREHKPAGISFICRWTQCGRHCRTHEKHLERHAMMTLQCAYQGCKESYRASSQLLKHFRAKHLNGMLKVQAKPFRPQPQPPVPLPNTILPSYLIVTAPVSPTPISPDQHSILGPWVLRNVVGFDTERPKRARKADSPAEASNTYEFLNMRSTRYSWNQSEPVAMDFDDLDSEEISKECDQGLTFFGSEDFGDEETPPNAEASPSLLFSSPPIINGDAYVETVNSDTNRLDFPTEPSDEEDAVQKLLIE